MTVCHNSPLVADRFSVDVHLIGKRRFHRTFDIPGNAAPGSPEEADAAVRGWFGSADNAMLVIFLIFSFCEIT